VLFPNGYYNLGVAHGVPGVVAVLAQAHAAGVAPGATEPLLEGAMRWLWAQAREKAPGPRFPTMVDERARDEEQSRLAWCYGDLGVATSLLGAARQVRRADWERQALELLARCAERSFASSGVNDAGLCHGATGNAQMFNRVFQATGDASFREAAEKWIDHALAYRKPGTGVGGFQAWIVNTTLEEAAWQDVPGFLEGAAGIALALLAATQPVEPRWDRLLLIAVDPAHRPAPVGA
jgi:lantibiotic modifying enzyme